MTIRTISRQRIGGATKKKDQAEWTNDGRLADCSFRAVMDPLAARSAWANCVHDFMRYRVVSLLFVA